MRSVHVCYGFPPDPIGGTEVFVSALARELARLGDDVLVTAPSERGAAYSWNGIPVRRFATVDAQSTTELYDEGDPVAAAEFDALLAQEAADVVHMHAFTRACSLRLVRAAKRRAPVVFTYHTPTVSCARGTLMEGGAVPCDGVVDAARCSQCVLQQHGVPAPLARLVTQAPRALARGAAYSPVQSRVGTALQMPELITRRHENFRALMREVDRAIALCGWTEALLAKNGVPAAQIARIPQTLCQMPRTTPPPVPHDGLRLLFMGRLHPDKGVDVLLDALAQLNDTNVSLDVYGTEHGRDGQLIRARLDGLAESNARVRLHAPVHPDEVPAVIAQHDLLVVPSQWLETGPLVVLEAFSAGVPVLGSALGGIAELVRDGVDGVLVHPFDDPSAWAAAIGRVSRDRAALDTMRSAIAAPPLMAAAAHAVKAVYEEVLAANPRHSRRLA
jgi:glycosyltransferase involved in cell wall biosynthesis